MPLAVAVAELGPSPSRIRLAGSAVAVLKSNSAAAEAGNLAAINLAAKELDLACDAVTAGFGEGGLGRHGLRPFGLRWRRRGDLGHRGRGWGFFHCGGCGVRGWRGRRSRESERKPEHGASLAEGREECTRLLHVAEGFEGF